MPVPVKIRQVGHKRKVVAIGQARADSGEAVLP